MKEYSLYLDESQTHDKDDNQFFCIAGVIVAREDEACIQEAVHRLKEEFWPDYDNPGAIILHEKDIKAAANPFFRKKNKLSAEYQVFKQKSVRRRLYEKIEGIFSLDKMTVLGSCIDVSKLYQYFPQEILADRYLIAIQIILENFVHFLSVHNGEGQIYYESRGEVPDRELQLRFNHIKAIGSMFVNPYVLQRHLREISFPSKRDNVEGLQIADFVPNGFARHAAGLQTKDSTYSTVRKYRYAGGIADGYKRFGVKFIP